MTYDSSPKTILTTNKKAMWVVDSRILPVIGDSGATEVSLFINPTGVFEVKVKMVDLKIYLFNFKTYPLAFEAMKIIITRTFK